MRKLSSRPDEKTTTIDALSPHELELIAALLCQVKLGFGSPYKMAAMTLIDKIETLTDDPNYLATACLTVDPQIEVISSAGIGFATLPGTHYEILV